MIHLSIKFSFIEPRVKYLKIYNEKKKFRKSCSPSWDEKSKLSPYLFPYATMLKVANLIIVRNDVRDGK